MKSSLPLIVIILSAVLSSCAGSAVRVVDSRTKVPVAGAAVKGVNGDFSTVPVYTDAAGYAPEVAPPNGPREIVVSRSGYNTKHLKLY